MRWLVAFAALAALAACDPAISPADNQQADRVREQEQALLAAVAAEDAAAVADLYAPDAQLLVAFTPPLISPEAIRDDHQRIFDDPNGALTISPSDVIMASAGDYAYSDGTFRLNYTDPASRQAATVTGHYVMVWRRQDDGSWKIIRDIATPTGPPPG